MRAVRFQGAGGNEVVAVVERPDPQPAGEDVVVAVRYAGLNPADLLQRAGSYPAPPGSPSDVPGLEVAGTVVACGERVTAWQVGDRVLGLVGGGGLADRVLVHERALVRVPDGVDEVAAAALPEAFATAHDAIRAQAGLHPGEALLVHGAAGGVGHAAVQIGRVTGARVFGTVRSAMAAEAVRALGGVPLDAGAFAAELREHAPAGADVVLELVGAPNFPANLDAVAECGRIVVVGVGAGDAVTLPLFALMRRRALVRGTVLRARPLEQKAAVLRALERELWPAFERGDIRPLVDSLHPIAEIHAAFDRLAASGKVGKVLVEF